jgi:transposase
VKSYVKRQKNDMADAEAICEAVITANMRVVPIKTREQQERPGAPPHASSVDSSADLSHQRDSRSPAEFGFTAPVGRRSIEELLHVLADPSDKRVPELVRSCLAALGSQLRSLKKQILESDRMILAWHQIKRASVRIVFGRNESPGVTSGRSQPMKA